MGQFRRPKARIIEPLCKSVEIVGAPTREKKEVPADQRSNALNESGAAHVRELIENRDRRATRGDSRDLSEQKLIRFFAKAMNDVPEEHKIITAGRQVSLLEIT